MVTEARQVDEDVDIHKSSLFRYSGDGVTKPADV